MGQIKEYGPKSPIGKMYARLTGGKAWLKTDLYRGLGDHAHRLLAWIKIHGKQSGKWNVVNVDEETVKLVRKSSYIHARLSKEDCAVLEDLKKATGQSESDLVRRGLRLVLNEVGRKQSALQVAGRSVGKFKNGPRDLSTNKKHLEGFGQ